MLTPLTPLAPLTAPSFNGGDSTAIKILKGAAATADPAKVALAVATGGASTLFGVSASRLIAIAVGLIVVAAAVFSFKPVRETVVGVSKDAAKAAIAA